MIAILENASNGGVIEAKFEDDRIDIERQKYLNETKKLILDDFHFRQSEYGEEVILDNSVTVTIWFAPLRGEAIIFLDAWKERWEYDLKAGIWIETLPEESPIFRKWDITLSEEKGYSRIYFYPLEEMTAINYDGLPEGPDSWDVCIVPRNAGESFFLSDLDQYHFMKESDPFPEWVYIGKDNKISRVDTRLLPHGVAPIHVVYEEKLLRYTISSAFSEHRAYYNTQYSFLGTSNCTCTLFDTTKRALEIRESACDVTEHPSDIGRIVLVPKEAPHAKLAQMLIDKVLPVLTIGELNTLPEWIHTAHVYAAPLLPVPGVPYSDTWDQLEWEYPPIGRALPAAPPGTKLLVEIERIDVNHHSLEGFYPASLDVGDGIHAVKNIHTNEVIFSVRM